jgi:hypothetical protein
MTNRARELFIRRKGLPAMWKTGRNRSFRRGYYSLGLRWLQESVCPTEAVPADEDGVGSVGKKTPLAVVPLKWMPFQRDPSRPRRRRAVSALERLARGSY